MQTIKGLLNKIRWDKREKPEDYALFYLDRISKKLVEVRVVDVKRLEDNFIVIEKEGKETYIPMHRIRKVEKKGRAVWER